MENNNKYFRRSAGAIACYVFAAIMLIYTFYVAGDTVGQINDYMAQYGMKASTADYIKYIPQNCLTPFINAFVLFMLGHIIDTIRKTDPKNFMTEEEYLDAKAAKKQAKEAKKLAKGAKKAAEKNGIVESSDQSVAADFASDLDKELKADAKKSGGNGNRKNNSGSGSYYRRQGGNKSGGNRNNNRNNQSKPKADEAKEEN